MLNKPGIYKISFADYLADPCPVPSLSRSVIKSLVMDCPIKAYHGHPRLNPDYKKEEKTIFDIGSAAHDCFLGGENAVAVFDYPDWRKKEAQEAKEQARQEGKIPLLTHQFEDVLAMVKVANLSLQNFIIRGERLNLKIEDGDSEMTYIWKENETWFRIRPDWVSNKYPIILDYKTTGQSASPEKYANIISDKGLDIQDALYSRGYKTLNAVEPDFFFMVQETEPPYLCSLIEIDMMFKDMGKEKVKAGIRIWRECMRTGTWTGYPWELSVVEPKPWALASWEMRKSALLEVA